MMNNLVILTGNLGQDPEIKTTTSGRSVAKASIATSDNYTDQSGNKVDVTDWHKIVAWGKQAEHLFERCKKGSKIIVYGKAKQNTYTKPDGTTAYDHYVQLTRFEVIEKPRPSSVWPADPATQATNTATTDNWLDDVISEENKIDDLPF